MINIINTLFFFPVELNLMKFKSPSIQLTDIFLGLWWSYEYIYDETNLLANCFIFFFTNDKEYIALQYWIVFLIDLP